MKLDDCMKEILAYNGGGFYIEYAKAYAKEWLANPSLARNLTQLRYVRNNLSGWRGDTAKQVRASIDAALKAETIEDR